MAGMFDDLIPQSQGAASGMFDDLIPQPSMLEDVAKSGGTGVEKALIANAGLPGDVRELAGRGADWLASKIAPSYEGKAGNFVKSTLRNAGGMTGAAFNLPTSGEVRQGVESVQGPLYEPKTTAGEYAQTGGEFLPAAAAGPGGLVRRLATQVALPAITSETAGQITKGTAAEPYARLAGAIGGPVGASLLRRAVAPPVISAERQAARAALEAEGIETTAGQASGNQNLLNKEATAGGPATAMEQRQSEQLTAAAIRRIGEDGTDVHAAVQAARPRIGQQIEDATQRLHVRFDRQIGDDISTIGQEMRAEGLAPEQTTRIGALIENVMNSFVERGRRGAAAAAPPPATINLLGQPMQVSQLPRTTGYLEGDAFHSLIKHGSPLQRATEAGGDVGYYANRIRSALFDAAERTATGVGTRAGTGLRQALEDFRQGRRQWANMLALEDASSGPGATAASGRLTPAAVRRAATFQQKTDLARGRGDFNDLARNSNMLMLPLPNSGTPGRLWSRLPAQLIGGAIGGALGAPMAGLGTGFGATAGAIAGPAIQGRMVMSGPMQRYLSSGALPPRTMAEHARRALISSMLTRPQLPPPLGMLDQPQ
jgi:hypothetical protein